MTLLLCLLSVLQFITGNDDITLLFAGDAMQHDRQIEAARTTDGMYAYGTCFEYVRHYIQAADFAVVNLECTLGGTPYRGYPCFSAPDNYALALKHCGFDFFLHANNHCLDRRDAGLIRTLDRLDEYAIPHTGTYRNQAERDTVVPHIVTVKGARIAILNYTYGTNGIVVQRDAVVDYINRETIHRDIEAARRAQADLIVVCPHWGNEYQLVQNHVQEELAEFLISEGVDMIIGSHPHVVQPMEIRYSHQYDKQVVIAYSLGNFISAMRTADTRGGVMLKIVVGQKNKQWRLKGAEYKLVFVQPPTDKDDNFRLIPAGGRDKVRKAMLPAYDRFMERARRVFDKHNKGIDEEWVVPLLPPSPLADEENLLSSGSLFQSVDTDSISLPSSPWAEYR